MSEGAFYKWKAKYARLTLNELKRLRPLEEENRRLEQIVAPAGVGQLVSEGVAGKKLLEPKLTVDGGGIRHRESWAEREEGLPAYRGLALGLPVPGEAG